SRDSFGPELQTPNVAPSARRLDPRRLGGSSRARADEPSALRCRAIHSPAMPGKLLIVGTPLGNLGDFPPRAVEALKPADLILCEDTRHTRKLLTHFGIDRPTDRLDDHTEEGKARMFAD